MGKNKQFQSNTKSGSKSHRILFLFALSHHQLLTQHGSLFEEFVAGLEGHLLQRGGVGPDGVPV